MDFLPKNIVSKIDTFETQKKGQSPQRVVVRSFDPSPEYPIRVTTTRGAPIFESPQKRIVESPIKIAQASHSSWKKKGKSYLHP